MTSIWNNKSHAQFDRRSMRILLTPKQIEALPFKTVNKDELWEVMATMEFNPTTYYPAEVEILPTEEGHDLNFRYIWKEADGPH
jgi:hypothetical protein